MADLELTRGEERAIERLRRVAEDWPNSLWLYPIEDTDEICIMRKTSEGKKLADKGHLVAVVVIENDKGDW